MNNNKEVKIENLAFETFKKACKELLVTKGFDNFNEMARAFQSLSIEDKIEALAFIKTLPQSTRKTLVFSAFVKSEKKKISREINQMGFLL